jgi:maltooligosyltrehalose trehalohydrolase
MLDSKTTDPAQLSRNIPIGAEFSAEAVGTHFRVWAPEQNSVSVTFEDSRQPVVLKREAAGYFSGFGPGVLAHATYKYQLNGGESYPDPARVFGRRRSRRVLLV